MQTSEMIMTIVAVSVKLICEASWPKVSLDTKKK